MKLTSPLLVVIPLLAAFEVAVGAPSSRDLSPDVVEGSLVAAACIGSGDRTPACTQRALAAGHPGGTLDGQHFTVLLVDGRILGRTCAAQGTGRLRAFGMVHRGGAAMSPYRLEQDCGTGWSPVDLPHTGTLAGGAAGGDE